jgi:hypothetical protein
MNPIPVAVRQHTRPAATGDRTQTIADTWPLFLAALDALAAPESDGMIVEDFAVVFRLFVVLVAAGVRFDESFVAWLESLEAQAKHTDDDSDSDGAGDDLEPDDQPATADVAALHWLRSRAA